MVMVVLGLKSTFPFNLYKMNSKAWLFELWVLHSFDLRSMWLYAWKEYSLAWLFLLKILKNRCLWIWCLKIICAFLAFLEFHGNFWVWFFFLLCGYLLERAAKLYCLKPLIRRTFHPTRHSVHDVRQDKQHLVLDKVLDISITCRILEVQHFCKTRYVYFCCWQFLQVKFCGWTLFCY